MKTLKKDSISIYDSAVGTMVSSFMVINSANLALKIIFPYSEIIQNNLTVVLGIIYLGIFFMNINKLMRSVVLLLLGEAAFIVALLISFLQNPTIVGQIISRSIWTIAFCIPLSVFVFKMDNIETLFLTLKKGIFVSFCILMAVFLYLYMNDSSYQMAYAYTLLPICLFHIDASIRNKKNLIFLVFELPAIVLFGSRGPILCIGAYVLLRYIYSADTAKRLLKISALSVSFTLFALFYTNILEWISNVMRGFGIHSRTLNLLINGNITSDSGRSTIIKMVWQKLLEKPIWGWGISGELNFMKSYPHQVFVEILVHFGFIFGTVFCLFIIWKVIKMLLNRKFNNINIIFFCAGFIPLLLSGSYLQSPFFWMFLFATNKKAVHSREEFIS